MNARFPMRWTLAVLAAFALSAPAQAQLFRAYLSTSGNDANPCTLAQPCRLLPAAIAAAATNGEVWMLDSANYNTSTVFVNKSVTILAIPGVVGSVVATGGPAMTIATAGVSVTLRNLVFRPLPGGGGTIGVAMTSGTSLTIDGTQISGMPTAGVTVTGNIALRIVDSTLRDNGPFGVRLIDGAKGSILRSTISGCTTTGLDVVGTVAATTTTADVADTVIERCASGGTGAGINAVSFNATAAVDVSVRDSRLVQNDIGAYVQASGPATLAVTASLVSNNTFGIQCGSGKVWVAGNTVTHNGTGLSNAGCTFESAGNNAVRNNTSNSSGAIGNTGTL